MVQKVFRAGKAHFQCKECGFSYKDRIWAEKCEQYCKKYHSCSLEITKHSVS
ncbi:hypothetical protein HYS31_08635 [Candidatus Woesearchaeota archaeon]|nr:hypothetical protein [Candidatus Woesearchaeota archaeon]